MPGSSTNLLQALLVRLACNTDPELSPLHAAAAGVFSESDAASDQCAQPSSSNNNTGGTGRDGSNSGIGNVGMSGKTPGASSGVLGGRGGGAALPQLGPLGDFLLGKWTEEVAHERALLARMGAL